VRVEEERGRTWGLLAEFETPDELLRAARGAREAGYRRMDAYTPFPIHGLSDAMGFRPTKLPFIVLAGGIIGCVAALGTMWFSAAIHYPINVAGKPYASWPMFIPITFEATVLFAALFAVFGMLGMNGLPMPYHPIFNAPRFAFASRDRFFLCVEARDPKYDEARIRAFFDSLGAKDVVAVEE
jgi:hypothetical protein